MRNEVNLQRSGLFSGIFIFLLDIKIQTPRPHWRIGKSGSELPQSNPELKSPNKGA